MRLPSSLLLLLLLAATVAQGQVPRTISFQGRAETASGPVTGTRQMTVSIYTTATGGVAVFTETAPVTFSNGGLFATAIGANTPGGIPKAVPFDGALWVGITITGVNGNAEFAPRYRLHTSPYSFRSELSERSLMADSAKNALYADSAARIPGLVGDGIRTRAALLDISDSGAAKYGAGLRVRGNPYAIISDGIDSIDGHLVVREPAGARTPSVGALYRDNVPVAWGMVVVNGQGQIALVTDFGIDSVVQSTAVPGVEFAYRVYMQRPMRQTTAGGTTIPQLSVTVTPMLGLQDNPTARTAMWRIAGNASTGQPDPSSFYIILSDSSGRNITGSFSFQVFGLLQ